MKGQVFSIDLMIALSLFFIVIGTIFYIWTITPNYNYLDLQERANSVAEYLATSRLGRESILGCTSVGVLANKSYDLQKVELSVSEFDIFVNFTNTTPVCNGNKINIGSVFNNATSIASVIRVVQLDKQKMQMAVNLYD